VFQYTEGNDAATVTKANFNLGQSARFQRPANTICDHVLELRILKAVMESPGGPCDQLVAMYANGAQPKIDDVQARWKPLKTLINDKTRNMAFTSSSLEKQKGQIVKYDSDPRESLNVDDTLPANNAHRLRAANDYLSKTKDGSATGLNTLQLAADLDAQIQTSFPGTTMRVVDEWNRILALADSLANPCPSGP